MSKKITTEIFIQRAKEIHGDKYDYSKVNYTKATEKVCIICPIHGEFWQLPYVHIKGSGCPKCAKENQRYTLEDFIIKARKVHKNKYDYSKVNYIDSHNKIEIICPIHGSFYQTPGSHLSGCGCPKCSANKLSSKLSDNTEQFIKKAREIHGDKYDYSKVDYINSKTKVIIICPKHGEFEISSHSHLCGNGCKKCNREKKQLKSLQSFITRSNQIHNFKYDYSKFKYINSKTKSTIICPVHGAFYQSADHHLAGKGCPNCIKYKGEEKIKKYLEEHYINYIFQYPINIDTNINKTGKTLIDFYLPDYNLFIEYNGKQHYKPVHFYGGELKFEHQQKRDEYVRNYCKENNVILLEIAYNQDIKNKLDEKLL